MAATAPTPSSPLDRAYADYRLKPSPDKLTSVVKHLEPTISYAVANTGGIDDPLMKQQARLFAAEAVKSFDPQHGAALPTWVSRQLMQMRRFKRARNSPLKLPERIQLDAYAISRAEAELSDKLGREPDMDELATRLGMPVKRIRTVKETFRRMPSEGAFGDGGAPASEPDFDDEALSYVHAGAGHLERRVIELVTGFGGNAPMEPKDVAAQLKITPSTLSRMRMRLALQVQETARALQGVSSL